MRGKFLIQLSLIISLSFGLVVPAQATGGEPCSCQVEIKAEHLDLTRTASGVAITPACEFISEISLATDGTADFPVLAGLILAEISKKCSPAMYAVLTDPVKIGVEKISQTFPFYREKSKTVTQENCSELDHAYARYPLYDFNRVARSDPANPTGFHERVVMDASVACSASGGGSGDTVGGVVPVDEISNEEVRNRFNVLNQIRGVGRGQFALTQIIGRIIFFFLSVIGTIAIAMFIYAGVTWMVKGGSPEARKKATEIMLWTTLGLAVLLGSAGIVEFIFNAFPATLP